MSEPIVIVQESYSRLEIDTREKDCILIWQYGRLEANVIIVDRNKIPELIEVLKSLTPKSK